MATTTNYGWTTPDDTALVKDGAAAIRSLGSAIDSTLKTQIDAQIPDSIVDAKGDLITATADNTPARLASSGTNGQVLTVDTSTSTGLKWAAAVADKNFTLINTGGTNLTGAGTVTVSGISGKDMLHIEVRGASSANASSYMYIRFNSDTGNNYSQRGVFLFGQTSTTIVFNNIDTAQDVITMATMAGNALDTMSGTMMVYGANTAGIKPFQLQGSATNTYLTNARGYLAGGHWSGSATISSVSFITSTGNWDAGSVFIYGA